MFDDVEEFSAKGLRTLMFAMREIDAELLGKRNWQQVKPEEIETNLTLLGATGVEDLLQDDVKMCVEDFRRAGMRVWMLTGDKGMTAQ